MLEINGNPNRRDLSEHHARLAVEAGATIVLNTDAHGVDTLDNVAYAVATARRAWLTPKDIANTRGWREFKRFLVAFSMLSLIVFVVLAEGRLHSLDHEQLPSFRSSPRRREASCLSAPRSASWVRMKQDGSQRLIRIRSIADILDQSRLEVVPDEDPSLAHLPLQSVEVERALRHETVVVLFARLRLEADQGRREARCREESRQIEAVDEHEARRVVAVADDERARWLRRGHARPGPAGRRRCVGSTPSRHCRNISTVGCVLGTSVDTSATGLGR